MRTARLRRSGGIWTTRKTTNGGFTEWQRYSTTLVIQVDFRSTSCKAQAHLFYSSWLVGVRSLALIPPSANRTRGVRFAVRGVPKGTQPRHPPPPPQAAREKIGGVGLRPTSRDRRVRPSSSSHVGESLRSCPSLTSWSLAYALKTAAPQHGQTGPSESSVTTGMTFSPHSSVFGHAVASFIRVRPTGTVLRASRPYPPAGTPASGLRRVPRGMRG